MEKQELKLIQDAQGGNTNAFDELVRMHDTFIMQVIYGMTDNTQDAQDIYQETFMKAFKNITSFRFDSKFSSWLCRIAMNNCINRIRRKKIICMVSLDKKREDQPGWDVKSGADTGSHVLNEEFNTILTEKLDKLSANQRAIFVMKHMHGFKISEIAKTLNCTEGTIKNQLFRAVQKLRVALTPYY